jgi:hypothetical protein
VVCEDCRGGANTARAILNAGDNAPMGSLFGAEAMGRHEKCPELARQRRGLAPAELAGSSKCDCSHEVPNEGKKSG